MGVQIVTTKVSVGVEPGTPAGTEETIVHRGAMIPDWVDQYTQFVLTSTGMGRYVEDPDPTLVAMANPPAPTRLPEHPPPAVPPAPEVERPARNASLERWRAYALAVEQSRGTPEADAQAAVEPLNRDELAERY